MDARDETFPEQEAFMLAFKAAVIHFDGAVKGLLAGHSAAIQKLREEYSEKDRAFLMALVLTEKGARLDKDGVMLKLIADGLRGKSLSSAERRLIEKADAP